jgi:hypothetical protein
MQIYANVPNHVSSRDVWVAIITNSSEITMISPVMWSCFVLAVARTAVAVF